MSKFKKSIITIISMFTIVTMSVACTPEEMAVWNGLSHQQKTNIIESISSSSDCYEAIDKHFSGDKTRMKNIIRRESGNNPAAQNKSSTARSCGQLLMSYHAWRFAEVGCPDVGVTPWRDTSKQWADPDCAIKAVDHLYREQGYGPWKLTDR